LSQIAQLEHRVLTLQSRQLIADERQRGLQ
jgi:hypothetical protein